MTGAQLLGRRSESCPAFDRRPDTSSKATPKQGDNRPKSLDISILGLPEGNGKIVLRVIKDVNK